MGSTSLGTRPGALVVTMACLLLGPLACKDQGTQPDDPVVLEPQELCSNHGDDAIATFEDPNLEFQVRWALSMEDGEDLTCGRISELRLLVAVAAGIESVAGIENLSGLTGLNLGYNPISEIDPVGQLTNLDRLALQGNSITDIAPLHNLTNLTHLILNGNAIAEIKVLEVMTGLTRLWLGANDISDIRALSQLPDLASLALYDNASLTDIEPLLLSPGLGTNDRVDLRGTAVGCADVDSLRVKGVSVTSDCPEPTADAHTPRSRSS